MDHIIEPVQSKNNFWQYIEILNNNKYFVGIIMILLNLGSKYISVELSQSQEKFLGSPIIRRLIWCRRKDSICVAVSGIFHDDSFYCLIPKKYRTYENNKPQFSKQDIEKAKEIIKISEEQNKNEYTNIEKFNQMKKNNYKNNMNKLSFISKMIKNI